LYTKIVEKYNLTLKDFNLDENEVPDININIGEISYELTVAKLHFIQWLYYTGLYDYLMSREDIKFDILNEMNSKKLLSGNLFLRYQIFLTTYETKEVNKKVSDKNAYDEEETEKDSDVSEDVSEDVFEDVSEEKNDFIKDFKSEIYNMRKYIVKSLL
jgi:hypothetical protein